MFKEEVTQYCPMCQEWAEKYKAKEQECERLKVDLNTKKTMMDGMMKCSRYTVEQLNSIIDQLKAENEHLSEKEEEAKHYLEEAEKFKNCLTEIKEITEGINPDCFYNDYVCDDGKDCDMSQGCSRLCNRIILQKISEVE